MAEIFFKTKVLLIDDDELIMESIKMAFPKQEFILCSDPQEGLAILERNELKLKTLLHEKNNPIALMKAYKTDPDIISIALIDYSMPDMSGEALIKKLGASVVQKILFTAHADSKIAVSLFNEGLIQQFMRKEEPNLLDHLESSMRRLSEIFLQQFFFEEKKERDNGVSLFKHLMKSVDQDWYDFYWPIGENGSYYVGRGDTKTLFLSISEEDQKQHANTARDSGLDELLVEHLKNGSLMLSFVPEIDDIPFENWAQNVIPAKKVILEEKTYYVSVIGGDDKSKLSKSLLELA